LMTADELGTARLARLLRLEHLHARHEMREYEWL